MNRYTKAEIAKFMADKAWWQEIVDMLGPEWRLIGYSYRKSASVSGPGVSCFHLDGALAERLHELAVELEDAKMEMKERRE